MPATLKTLPFWKSARLKLSAAMATAPLAGTLTPFTNERNGEVFRYLRVYTDVAGDIATGINFTAHIRPIQ